eukprot:CAMPEP_0179054394 /NCGR_PEP_ID=MMETSP0796-20121207/22763_1 /TAXON_ID=73915 /ORGANISM="Pyrodinium bahamense, Strain pbaha01" /LENGTH=371 /DNA_ID=CAMNT_0020751015 /DNA_START=81 /DNA_END=1194 /DNA_ORIENTATION=-
MVLRYRSTGNLRRTCAWRRACAAAAGLAVAATRALDPPIPACRCDAPNTEKGKGRRDEDGDEGGEDFDFSFAQPPVASAPINWQFSTRIAAAAIAGARPHAEVIACSTFSLPVERGWPRDTLSPEEVAVAMRDTLADRLPRWAAEKWRLALLGAPPPLRGLRGGWPRAAEGALPATLSWSFLPAPFPPLLTIRQLPQTDDAVQFELGGLACVGSSAARLCVACEALGTSGSAEPGPGEEVSERLDLKLTTSLSAFLSLARLGLFSVVADVGGGNHTGCQLSDSFCEASMTWLTSRWHSTTLRRSVVDSLALEGKFALEGRCQQGDSTIDMAHEQMALHYVAALRIDSLALEGKFALEGRCQQGEASMTWLT